jgi:hypothetical protein
MLLVGLSGTALVALSGGAGAADRPATWNGLAEAAGFRFSVLKPAQLPTADEVAGLSIPFAHAESDSSPAGRAIGSWLWPGETAAAAKSLLLVGLDPSAAESDRQQRERENPGHGCDPKRPLGTPAVTDPTGSTVIVPAQTLRSPITNEPIYDPTDNPCGEAAARTALQTAVNERVPEYPFWAHSLWPPVSASDRMDRSTICDTPAAFPPSYELPPQTQRPCPDTGQSGGMIEAISNENGNWGTAQVSSFDVPGIATARQITSLARTEWLGNVLLSSATVTIEDLTLLGPNESPFVHIDALTSTAVIASDDRAPVTRLDATGVTVALGGTRYDAVIERDRIRVADQSLPEPVQKQMTTALDALSRRVTFGTCAADAACSVAGADAAGDASAQGAGAGVDEATRTARVAGVAIALTGTNSVEGATTLRLSFGLAEASALTRVSPQYSPPPFTGFGGGASLPGGGFAAPAPGAQPAPFFESGPQVLRGAPVRGVLPSEPVPAAVVLVAILGMVAGGGALVAAGVWETTT